MAELVRSRPGLAVRFLASASAMPSALLIEGEPGIGKTTLWLAAVGAGDVTAGSGCCLRAPLPRNRCSRTRRLADLFDGVDAAAWPDLPAPQRLAVDQVLLRADHGAATDQRAVAAAFLSVVQRLADDGPVLLAIDDLQWLDVSTMHVVAFAARRLSGPVGFLGSVRTEVGSGATAGWLQMPRPDAVSRILLHPLGVHDLHAAVSARLRRSFSRPTIGRIHEVSGGNPFYAIELARTIDERVPGVDDVAATHARRTGAGTDRQPRSRRARCPARRIMHVNADGRTGHERHDQRRRSSGRTARACREQRHHRHRRQPHSLRASDTCQRRVHRGRARTTPNNASTARRDRRRTRTAGAAPGVGRDPG